MTKKLSKKLTDLIFKTIGLEPGQRKGQMYEEIVDQLYETSKKMTDIDQSKDIKILMGQIEKELNDSEILLTLVILKGGHV